MTSTSAVLASLQNAKPSILSPRLGSQPSIIPPNFSPSVRVNVAFGEQEVQLGNVVRAGSCKEAPEVRLERFTNVEGDGEGKGHGQRYTLMLLDPDAPTPDEPKFGYWRHWVVRGLRAGEGGGGDAKTLTAWLGPGPKDESGPHRYLFLVFKEPEGFEVGKEDVGGEEFVDRRSFDAVGRTKKMRLELVGLNWMYGVGDGWSGEV